MKLKYIWKKTYYRKIKDIYYLSIIYKNNIFLRFDYFFYYIPKKLTNNLLENATPLHSRFSYLLFLAKKIIMFYKII